MHYNRQVVRCSHFHVQHASCLIGLLVILFVGGYAPLPSEAQHTPSWAAPFSPSSAQDASARTSYNTWGTTQQDEDRNAWNTEDPWNNNDPWGLEERDRSYGESDWTRDFYDFDDENESGESGKGSTDRVGNGFTMNNGSSCNARGNPNNGGCVKACGSRNPPVAVCQDVCDRSPNGDACQAFRESRFGATGTPQETPVPGIIYLLLAGLGYGGYRLRGHETEA